MIDDVGRSTVAEIELTLTDLREVKCLVASWVDGFNREPAAVTSSAAIFELVR